MRIEECTILGAEYLMIRNSKHIKWVNATLFTFLLLIGINSSCDAPAQSVASFSNSNKSIYINRNPPYADLAQAVIEHDSVAQKKQEAYKASRVRSIPDFSTYKDVKAKKKAFFEFLRPIVVEENNIVLEQRTRLVAIYDEYQKKGTTPPKDLVWLSDQAEYLRVSAFDISDSTARLKLAKKIDIIPEAMFLAQAANESGWGTSRFAQEANNLFGQWCFSPGCGIIPSQREAGDTHEVRKFATINDAVASYIHNINRHRAYRKLRNLRYQQRLSGITPTGMVCAEGLSSYSQRGMAYVKEIQQMILQNDLE